MGEFSRQLDDVAALFSRAAAEQGGVISGDIPTNYSASNPFRLWVIQVVIIISFSQILAVILARIKQPRVIAEVIGGILLGPTVMGRIPNFKDTIFPDPSMPLLTLTATIGLILFLFLVGLEIDTRLLKRNAKASAAVSIAGLVIPLGLGAALGVGIYREFIDPSVNFGYFLLFVAVAIGITAFPVLCRILTELKLLDTQVGVVVLSAGIGNDVVGWVLLALVVALVNASSGLTALWVLLASAGYTIFLLYPMRWAFVWLARRTGSLEQGTPTPFMMTVTLLLVFVNAFFTDIIGVHAIFGGFLAGLIVPHDNGFAVALTEKIEDLVTILLIPIYFTLSGLRTNLGTLNNGITWAYTILICLVAFASKFIPCAGAALAFGFKWREAGAIGSLMSCKGLVELIVLNIGLQAGVLDTRTFSMFVVHALVLTFVTTPLTLLFYPARYRTSPNDVAQKPIGDAEETKERPDTDAEFKTKFSLVLEKVEQLAPAMVLTQLLQPNESSSITTVPSTIKAEEAYGSDHDHESESSSKIEIDTLRLVELTNRTSAVMRSQESEALIYNDPVLTAFRTFGSLNRVSVSGSLSVVSFDEFSNTISQHAANLNSELVIIPWARGTTSVVDPEGHDSIARGRNPFDGAFHKTTTQDQTTSVVYSDFIRSVFLRCSTDVALFVDRGVPTASITSQQRLFLPFFGGPDDRLALSFLVQLCVRTGVRATVVRIQKSDAETTEQPITTPASPGPVLPGPPAANNVNALTVAAADTVYGALTTHARLASDTEDNLIWERYTGTSSTHTPAITSAIGKITFITESSVKPLHRVVELATNAATDNSNSGKTLIIIAGRSRRLAVEALGPELRQIISETHSPLGSSAPKTLGDVGAALVATGVKASLLIMQAASSSSAARN